MDLLDGSSNTIRFVGEHSANHTNVSWHGFNEPCSGIREYTVAIERLDDGEAVWRSSVVYHDGGLMHSVLPAELLLSLVDGAAYEAIVYATSHSGLTGSATHRFTIDRTPPTGGVAFNADMSNVACQSISDPIRVSWHGVQVRSLRCSTLRHKHSYRPISI